MHASLVKNMISNIGLGAVKILCQPKMGGPDLPSPPCRQKSEIGLPPLPHLSEIIFCHTPINKIKYNFQKESLNLETI